MRLQLAKGALPHFLVRPSLEQLSTNWSRTFSSLLPQALSSSAVISVAAARM
jgi:hypothetical protein